MANSKVDLLLQTIEQSALTYDDLIALADEVRAQAEAKHEEEVPGYWSTTDEYGNIDGQYATSEEALERGPGQYPHYVEIEEDDEEALAEWRQMRAAEKANPFKSRTSW